ncbi:MAG: HAD family hydrolase [Saprospiraceae bacterium]
MKYKSIIFDCDGVLVDSEAISNAVLLSMAKELGAKITLEYAEQEFSGKSLKSAFDDIEQHLGRNLPASFEKEYRQRTYEAFKTQIQPVKGIHEVINALSVPFCVASSGPLEKIKLNLKTTELLDKFEGRIFSSYEIGSWKPDPGIFEYAAAKMGFKPEECVVIEDSVAGVQAAKKGGFDVFGFGNQRTYAALEEEGAQVFFKMENLLGLLDVHENYKP